MSKSNLNDRQPNVVGDKNTSGATESLSAAQKLAAEANEPPANSRQSTPSKTLLASGIAYAVSEITNNKSVQEKVAEYGAELLKTAAFVMPGRIGYLGTTVLSALDHAHTGESSSSQATDMALGALSGLANRGAYKLIGKGEGLGSPANAGIAFSIINRSTDALFDKKNYVEPDGKTNITRGLGNAMTSVFDRQAIGTDAMLFGGSLYASKLAESISPILKTPSMRRITMGTVFGFTNGINEEINAEKGNKTIDYLAVAKSGLAHGLVDGLAFGLGGIRENSGLSDIDPEIEMRAQSTIAEHGARVSLGTRLQSIRRLVEAEWLRHPSEEPPRKVLGTELPSELEGLASKKHPGQLAYVSGTEPLEYRTEQDGPFNDYVDFIKRGIVKIPTAVRTYHAGEGSVPIVIPEEYAKDLDSLRNNSNELTPERQLELQQRVGPSDVAEALVYLPDRSYFKKVIISDKPNPDDTWVTQDYKEGKEPFVSAMGVLRGEVALYKKNKDVYFQGDLKHEWSHELHDRHYDEPLSWGFGNAVDLEKNEWSARDYMRRSKKDQFAVTGERMLGTDEAEFLEATEKAPLRSIFYMKALEKALQEVAPENRSVAHDEYARRVSYVQTHVIPKAMEKLNGFLETGDIYQQQSARNVLYNMGMEGMIPAEPAEPTAIETPPSNVKETDLPFAESNGSHASYYAADLQQDNVLAQTTAFAHLSGADSSSQMHH